MKWLAIVRHGEAAHGHPDVTRRLTPRGERDAVDAGRWLAACEALRGARLWASPLTRAQQTAAAIAEACGTTLETVDGMTPDDDVSALIERLTRDQDPRPLVLVSHLPLVASLMARLVADDRPPTGFPTAGIALLKADVWAAGCAERVAFVAPPYPRGETLL